jgi:hypothetical protein
MRSMAENSRYETQGKKLGPRKEMETHVRRLERKLRTAGLLLAAFHRQRLDMNAKILIAAVFVLCASALRAEEPPPRWDMSTSKLPAWKDPRWGEPMDQTPSRITLGKSDFVMGGALVDTFRPPPRSSGERTLAHKILSLPILNMFVPGPMPKPGRGGQYFAWGERDTPWSAVAERRSGGPQGVLVSVSR